MLEKTLELQNKKVTLIRGSRNLYEGTLQYKESTNTFAIVGEFKDINATYIVTLVQGDIIKNESGDCIIFQR